MSSKLKVLDLFSGIGGFSLGLERTGGFETVAFCEIEEFPQKVLKKHWPAVPIYNDVRTLKHDGPIDVITGGYPCQPFSVAGKRQGQADDRHLWPAMFRLIKKHRPTWVIGENVAGHIGMGLDDVLADLEGEEYAVRAFIIPAVAVDAKHRRDRVWIIAHSESNGRHKGQPDARGGGTGDAEGQEPGPGNDCGTMANTTGKQNRRIQQPGVQPDIGTGSQPEIMAHTKCKRYNGRWQRKGSREGGKQDSTTVRESHSIDFTGCGETMADTRDLATGGRTCSWPIEPGMGRVAHGIPKRVDRLKGLGNAVVPQIPEMIGYAILEAEFQNRSQL